MSYRYTYAKNEFKNCEVVAYSQNTFQVVSSIFDSFCEV